MKILLTAFGPFLSNSVNPSEELLSRDAFLDFSRLILPVSYSRGPTLLTRAIKEANPDIILSFGFASSRKEISIEKKARNLLDSTHPDVDGLIMRNVKIDSLSPEFLYTETDIDGFLAEYGLKDKISISLDAGSYLCNEIYYLSLLTRPTSIFVHLPPVEFSSLKEDKEFALKLIKYLEEQEKA